MYLVYSVHIPETVTEESRLSNYTLIMDIGFVGYEDNISVHISVLEISFTSMFLFEEERRQRRLDVAK